jgi:hypothetical protein
MALNEIDEKVVITPYRTADFAAICVLYYLGFELDGFERDARFPGKVAAYFKRSNELDTALQSLWSKQLNVEPLSFLETTRAVKARLRDCA